MIIEEIEKTMDLSKVIVWSDGCGVQFCSRFVFKFLSFYRTDLIIEWNYNEAHHGKGPMDGIGSTIKNVVYRKVKTGKVIVNSTKEFHEAANKFIPSIKLLFQRELLKELVDIESAPKIPNTLKMHKSSRNTSVSRECYLSNDQAPFDDDMRVDHSNVTASAQK